MSDTPTKKKRVVATTRLFTTVPLQRWEQDAACYGAAPDSFFPHSEKEAKLVIRMYCNRCPVMAECRARWREMDLSARSYGIWFGTSARQRASHSRSRSASGILG